MLIGNSIPEYIFIRVTIIALRLVAPLSLIYILIIVALGPDARNRYRWPLPLEVWMLAEAIFFLFVYLPLRSWLQREASHPAAPGREDREVLVQRCLGSIQDPNAYLPRWFMDAPPDDVRRDNVKELFAWSFLNKDYEDAVDQDHNELDGYVDRLGVKLGHTFADGRGEARSLRGTIDGVPMQHRPLVWYAVSRLRLGSAKDELNAVPDRQWVFRISPFAAFAVFPFQPLSLLTWRTSPARSISYWHREHTSENLPVLFIHGISIGLYAYVDFLAQLSAAGRQQALDGDVGIIAVELMSISSRICPPALTAAEVRQQIKQILDSEGWEDFVLVGHSFGTAVAANLLKDADLSKRIKSLVLIDPISILLHLPDVAYNFTRRKPTQANEHMLHYFSSQDMMISHTLARQFFWSEYILWKEDIADLPVTVSLSGRDLIVPTPAVCGYLTDGALKPGSGQRPEGDREWENELLKVLWWDKFDHASLFSSKGARRALAKEVLKHCKRVSS